ncbi:MAG: DUF6491 family protein [Gammaproteobacteria bacterium]|nr:DUF6491 family protein [Gammaproteobacteria bacterium]
MKVRLILMFACLAYAFPSAALPPADGSTEVSNLGESVLSITSANRISDWEHIDAQHVVLSMSPDERYLLTLKRQCGGLSWAQHIGVTMSNNTIWAKFDAVTTDGLQCPIERINRVTRKQVDALKI